MRPITLLVASTVSVEEIQAALSAAGYISAAAIDPKYLVVTRPVRSLAEDLAALPTSAV